MYVDKAKIRDIVQKAVDHTSGFASAYDQGQCKAFSEILREIDKGTFDLVPTDVDVKEIEDILDTLFDGYSIEQSDVKILRLLLTKYTETLAQMEDWKYKAEVNAKADEIAAKDLIDAAARVEKLESEVKRMEGALGGTAMVVDRLRGRTP